MDRIKWLKERIGNNLFINDLQWRERAENNKQYADKIREIIAMDDIIDKQFIVDSLDFLDRNNL